MACTKSEFEISSACWNALTPAERDAAIVYYLCQAVAACAGGVTCTVDGLTTLVACYESVPDEVLHAYEVQVAQEAAVAAGAEVATTLDTLQDQTKCLKELSPKTLRAMKLVLRCQLNACISGE